MSITPTPKTILLRKLYRAITDDRHTYDESKLLVAEAHAEYEATLVMEELDHD